MHVKLEPIIKVVDMIKQENEEGKLGRSIASKISKTEVFKEEMFQLETSFKLKQDKSYVEIGI